MPWYGSKRELTGRMRQQRLMQVARYGFAGCQHQCSPTTLSLTLPGTHHVSGLRGRLIASLTDLSMSRPQHEPHRQVKAVSRHGNCQA